MGTHVSVSVCVWRRLDVKLYGVCQLTKMMRVRRMNESLHQLIREYVNKWFTK